jgi:hypothetical protein
VSPYSLSVTPALREGSGFSGRSCSPKGQPGPQEGLCGVHVGVGLVAARQAAGYRLGDTVPRRGVPAPGTAPGGVAGVYCHHHPSGAFSLGVQDRQETPLPRVADRLVQAGLGRRPVRFPGAITGGARFGPPGHVRDLEVFADNHVVSPHQRERGLVRVVNPAPAHLRVQTRDPGHRLTAPAAAPLVAGKCALGVRQAPGRGGERARVRDMPAALVTGRPQRKLVCPSHTHPVPAADVDHGPGRSQRRRGTQHEPYEPVLTPPGSHTEGRERGFTSSPKAGAPAAYT